MKYLVVIAVILGLVFAAYWGMFIASQPTASAQIRLSSQPFPLAVGPSTVLVSLTDAYGSALDGAVVEVSGTMLHKGMLPVPLTGRASVSTNGVYAMRILWPMLGDWIVDITATLPDQQRVQERFEIFIYDIPRASNGGDAYYKSVGENAKLAAQRPSNELWIVIPQGTQAMMRAGQGDDIIPLEIRLNLAAQHTLVIQNNDITDHTIGPFFVRAGETVRQTFTRPAVYQGVCSIRHSEEVNIIVES